MMFIDHPLAPNEVSVIKLTHSEANYSEPQISDSKSNSSLEIMGFSSPHEAIFQYKNGNVSQTFGVHLGYYKPHIIKEFRYANGKEFTGKLTDNQETRHELSEGPYVLKPEYEGPNNYQYHYPYSILDKKI